MSAYMPTLLIFFLLFYMQRRNKTAAIKSIFKRTTEGNISMKELAKKFIDKECIVTVFDSGHSFQGTVKEVSDSALLIEDKTGNVQALNLNFILSVREYPRNKNGKKKAVFM